MADYIDMTDSMNQFHVSLSEPKSADVQKGWTSEKHRPIIEKLGNVAG
jgi:hypothetical protein